ncbi:hypothetical protein C1X73_04110 [Pseudomonas sp. FW305-130]|nr:hypothetical protein C1X74_00485 [Pseudomonas sp. GW460-5]PNB61963.1 hypothetical protein C1X73_04110 [Pseudomonas sp. FW305-130]
MVWSADVVPFLSVGAGVPAKQATRCMAPASPVFVAMAAPTVIASPSSHATRCPQIGENRRGILPNLFRLIVQAPDK